MPDVAIRSDWKTLPMPAQRALLKLDLTFDNQEFERLRLGEVPKQMEDKWFMYFEQPWLYLHRSWTGFCVYQVRFHVDGPLHRVAEAIVNRDPEQHRGQGDAQDALLLKILLFNRVGRDTSSLLKKYMDGFPPAQAMQ